MTTAAPVNSHSVSFRDQFHDRVSISLVLTALTFNASLCFINTVLFPVNDLILMGAELLLVTVAMLFAIDRRPEPYLVLALFLSYALLIMAMRPMFDAKAVRDFLIPIAFYLLGRRRPSLVVADRAALASGLIVVTFGLFEYLDLETFQKYFNIIRYYIARGTVATYMFTSRVLIGAVIGCIVLGSWFVEKSMYTCDRLDDKKIVLVVNLRSNAETLSGVFFI